ncbi:hypothetical protein [Halovivax sp.]|uniref:hypothetical protein n=1 Tax=Halovivax sp. TaxID=1935978 RepID=UPI0025BAA984|nr:hypothetical protein [Halovivax sp.]
MAADRTATSLRTRDRRSADTDERRVSEIEREAVTTALGRLDATGDVTDRQRAAVEALAGNVVATLAPAAIETVRTARPDAEHRSSDQS